jgi:hypothetical protein
MHIAANLTTLAFAELVLALAASVLVAACSRAAVRRPGRHQSIRQSLTGEPRRRSS